MIKVWLNARKTKYKCFNQDELEVTEEELINDGYGFIESYDMSSMSWKIKITEVREAADENQDQETN